MKVRKASDPSRPALPRPIRRLLLFVSALVFTDTIFFTALTPLLPHYVHVVGLSKAGAGILVAAYPAGTLISALPAGLRTRPPRQKQRWRRLSLRRPQKRRRRMMPLPRRPVRRR